MAKHKKRRPPGKRKPNGLGIAILKWLATVVGTAIITTILEHYIPLILGWQ